MSTKKSKIKSGEARESSTPAGSAETFLSGFVTDADSAYQENVRLYGPEKARLMNDASKRRIAIVYELLQGVKHEGSMNAIKAGRKVDEWLNHISPVLRTAYNNATQRNDA